MYNILQFTHVNLMATCRKWHLRKRRYR